MLVILIELSIKTRENNQVFQSVRTVLNVAAVMVVAGGSSILWRWYSFSSSVNHRT